MRRILTVAASTVAMICLLATASAHAEEAPPAPIEPQIEASPPVTCHQWLEWLVDGNWAMVVRVSSAALNEVAKACLGREGDPRVRHPFPLKPQTAPEPEPQPDPEPTADRVNI